MILFSQKLKPFGKIGAKQNTWKIEARENTLREHFYALPPNNFLSKLCRKISSKLQKKLSNVLMNFFPSSVRHEFWILDNDRNISDIPLCQISCPCHLCFTLTFAFHSFHSFFLKFECDTFFRSSPLQNVYLIQNEKVEKKVC